MLKNIKFDVRDFARELGINEIIARILVNRGIADKHIAHKFIKPTLGQLYDPKLMKDLERGALIIQDAIEERKKVLVVGDYDVDGVISTYLLYTALIKCGADVYYHIPDRVKEGYGINESIIRTAKEDSVDVIITCDNGIAAIEQVRLAKKLGMTVIITDHHDIQFVEKADKSREYIIPNADAIINPKQLDCRYPFKCLCGAGVVFKFAQVLYALVGIRESEAYNLLEYAAIATVCDVVDLTDENRVIVKNGLELMNKTNNLGLKALFEETGISGNDITVYSLGFVIGPSINASGRLEQAMWALELLLSKNENYAKELAKKLYELNKERQEITNNGVETAIQLIDSSEIRKDKVLVIYTPHVHESVAGIIAGRIREKYNLPTIVLTKGEDGVKGSGRSIEEYNMFEELLKCKDLLEKFGGHPMAAGLSLKEENIKLFRQRLNENCLLTDQDIVPKLVIDMRITLKEISIKLANEISRLEPFGKGNSKPLFADKGVWISKAKVIGKNSNVLKLVLRSSDGHILEGISFNGLEDFEKLVIEEYGEVELQNLYNRYSSRVKFDIAFSIDVNEYRGNKSVQLLVRSFRKSSL